jgi:hypothetical protein
MFVEFIYVYVCPMKDPFELSHDLGRRVDRKALFHIRGEFMRAFNLLARSKPNSLAELFQNVDKGFREK